MCLAIPGQVTKLDDEKPYATVDVAQVQRRVNVDLLRSEELDVGDWVLIHVGFAMSKISEAQAEEQMQLLQLLGEDDEAREEVEGYRFDDRIPTPSPSGADGTPPSMSPADP